MDMDRLPGRRASICAWIKTARYKKGEKEKQMKQAGDMLIGDKDHQSDKVIFDDPETTKLDVIQYMKSIGAYAPYLPQNTEHCPRSKGVTRPAFTKSIRPAAKVCDNTGIEQQRRDGGVLLYRERLRPYL